MALNNVPSGKSLPNDFNVIIEITAHSEPVKYEVDKESGAIFVDRFMSTSMHYPCNYGYIPHTIAGDGDPVDVLVVSPFPLPPGVVVRCRPIGMLAMTDEGGEDAKLLAVPVDKLTPMYRNVRRMPTCPICCSTRLPTSSSTTRISSRASSSRSSAGVVPKRPRRKSSMASSLQRRERQAELLSPDAAHRRCPVQRHRR
jgi:inorganic pyrophosphatase